MAECICQHLANCDLVERLSAPHVQPSIDMLRGVLEGDGIPERIMKLLVTLTQVEPMHRRRGGFARSGVEDDLSLGDVSAERLASAKKKKRGIRDMSER